MGVQPSQVYNALILQYDFVLLDAISFVSRVTIHTLYAARASHVINTISGKSTAPSHIFQTSLTWEWREIRQKSIPSSREIEWISMEFITSSFDVSLFVPNLWRLEKMGESNTIATDGTTGWMCSVRIHREKEYTCGKHVLGRGLDILGRRHWVPFISPPSFGEGLYSFTRVRRCECICMYPSSLRRCWSKSNVQYTKSTWNGPLMTTTWRQIVSVIVIVSYSRKCESRLLLRSTEILQLGPASLFCNCFFSCFRT